MTQPIIEINTRFLVRGGFEDFETTFQRSEVDATEVTLARRGDVEVLKQKKWFKLEERDFDLLGRSLVFRVDSFTRFAASGLPSEIHTSVPWSTMRLPARSPRSVPSATRAH